MRTKAYRRHQTYRHLWRRLKEDRNQHYDDLDCPCWHDRRAMARFREQPQICSCEACGNYRRRKGNSYERLSMAERRVMSPVS